MIWFVLYIVFCVMLFIGHLIALFVLMKTKPDFAPDHYFDFDHDVFWYGLLSFLPVVQLSVPGYYIALLVSPGIKALNQKVNEAFHVKR